MIGPAPNVNHGTLPVQPHGWSSDFLLALMIYWLSTSIVLGAAFIGPYFIELCQEHPSARQSSDLFAWDGEWYTRIAAQGYSYDPRGQSSVAFFPAYPLLSSVISGVTGLPVGISLLFVSHGSLVLALFFLLRYLQLRFPKARSVWYYSVAGAAFFPTTFFFRMPYTESMFLLLSIVVLYGIERGWKPLYLATIVGLATATRLPGVALFVPLAYDVWRRHSLQDTVRKLVVLAPVSMWGLALYIGYQAWEFGEPLAFQQTQAYWLERRIPDNFSAIVTAYLTLEPIRAVYDAECDCYWAKDPPRDSAALSLQFMNPIYVIMAAGLVMLGWARGWLNQKEILMSALLLLIPYVLVGYRTCMVSQARYVSVAFPQFIVVGHLLARLPTWMSVILTVASAGLMATYSAMFTSWYWYW